MENIQDWLQEKIGEEVGLPKNEIDCDLEFENFNLDSLSLVSVSFDLENLLNQELSPTIFTEFNTINKLSEWLKSQN
jgi:acyl carrier protein